MGHPQFSIGFVFLVVSSGACAAEGEWSRFRGPNGSGISEATTVPVKWTDQDYNWKIRLPGPGSSSPVLWGRRIYVTCGDPQTAQRSILCLDTADGRTLWRRDYPSSTFRQHGDNGYATATPAVDAAGIVLTWTTPEEVVLLALDHEGRPVWRRHLGPYVGIHGSGISPILFQDLVILANDQEDPNQIPNYKFNPSVRIGKSSLLAFQRGTGKTHWQLERRTSLAPYSTPCINPAEGGRSELIFTSTAHGITAVDPATGKVKWEKDKVFLDRCVGSPVVAPGLVFAGYGSGLRGVLWLAVRPGSQESDQQPQIAYELNRNVPLVPTPVVKDGRLYLWSDDGIVSCFKVANGEMVWRERAGGFFYGSPVCVNNRLYCISRSGEVVVIAASDKFEVLGRVSLGEPSFATPAIAGGVMYLRTRTQLFSLGGKRAIIR